MDCCRSCINREEYCKQFPEKWASAMESIIRFTMFICNFIILLFSLGLIILCVWAFYTSHNDGRVEGVQAFGDIQDVWDAVFNIHIGFMIGGIAFFVLSMVVIIAILRDNIILLRIYEGAVIVLLVVEFGLALTLFITSSSLRRHFSQTMIEHGIDTYRQESYEDFTSFIDWLQIELECCGVESYKDWNKNTIYFSCNETVINVMRCSVPFSCCRQGAPEYGRTYMPACAKDALKKSVPAANDVIYTKGCVQAFIDDSLLSVAAVVTFCVVCQILSVIMADYLCHRIKLHCRENDSET